MKERPILYSTPMVQAKLAGRKTQTRRIVEPQPIHDNDGVRFPWATFFNNGIVFTWDDDGFGGENWDAKDYPNENKFSAALKRTKHSRPCPYGKVGDILWTRETWAVDWEIGENSRGEGSSPFFYKASDEHPFQPPYNKWKPSIHMPKIASRIWERITDIRVERLQDISEYDARCEGHDILLHGEDSIAWYKQLWESINGPGSLELNPWVWCITTEVLSTTGRPAELIKPISLTAI